VTAVAVLGSGAVGRTLAGGLFRLGHDVVLASRTGRRIESWEGAVATFAEAAQGAELVILAVEGTVAKDLAASIAIHLRHKTVIDATNPISETAPTDGVLAYFTTFEESLMERLQRAVLMRTSSRRSTAWKCTDG
jgi:predicted dinucleotide-binding enzyme